MKGRGEKERERERVLNAHKNQDWVRPLLGRCNSPWSSTLSYRGISFESSATTSQSTQQQKARVKTERGIKAGALIGDASISSNILAIMPSACPCSIHEFEWLQVTSGHHIECFRHSRTTHSSPSDFMSYIAGWYQVHNLQ